MASLILLLSEVFKQESPDLLLAGAHFQAPSSGFSASPVKGKKMVGFPSFLTKKSAKGSPDNGGDNIGEDPSELKVSVDMVWP